MVHIGYCIGRAWWHQGITSEAMKAVIDFFFEEVGESYWGKAWPEKSQFRQSDGEMRNEVWGNDAKRGSKQSGNMRRLLLCIVKGRAVNFRSSMPENSAERRLKGSNLRFRRLFVYRISQYSFQPYLFLKWSRMRNKREAPAAAATTSSMKCRCTGEKIAEIISKLHPQKTGRKKAVRQSISERSRMKSGNRRVRIAAASFRVSF